MKSIGLDKQRSTEHSIFTLPRQYTINILLLTPLDSQIYGSTAEMSIVDLFQLYIEPLMIIYPPINRYYIHNETNVST